MESSGTEMGSQMGNEDGGCGRGGTSSYGMSRPVSTFSRSISLIGIFLCSEKVRCRKSIGARKVKVSISSLAAA